MKSSRKICLKKQVVLTFTKIVPTLDLFTIMGMLNHDLQYSAHLKLFFVLHFIFMYNTSLESRIQSHKQVIVFLFTFRTVQQRDDIYLDKSSKIITYIFIRIQ